MDKLVPILTSNPLVTLLVAAVLLLVFMFLFKNTIKQYLIKKFDLYDEVQMKDYAEYNHRSITLKGKGKEDTFNRWKNDIKK